MKRIVKVVLCIVLGFIVVFVLFFFGLFVTNKILSQKEISTIQDYGEKLTLNDKKINVSLSGDKKNKTIILLPGFATPSPVIDFSELIDELSNDFYVVTIEPFGYGLSDDTMTERTLENINQEIHAVIETLNLNDYVLMGHSISGIYTLDYMNRYSDEVSTFIGIDSSVPNQSGVEDDMGEALSILKNFGVYR